MKSIERRTLLKSSAVLGAASLLGTSQGWAGANDRMRVAMIGMGGRGGSVMKTVADIDGIEVATVCDPDENRMRERAGELEARTGKLPKREPDLRRIMDDSSIDAVVITCCNHWHAMAGILACQSGCISTEAKIASSCSSTSLAMMERPLVQHSWECRSRYMAPP